jgi:hypothetical protein
VIRSVQFRTCDRTLSLVANVFATTTTNTTSKLHLWLMARRPIDHSLEDRHKGQSGGDARQSRRSRRSRSALLQIVVIHSQGDDLLGTGHGKKPSIPGRGPPRWSENRPSSAITGNLKLAPLVDVPQYSRDLRTGYCIVGGWCQRPPYPYKSIIYRKAGYHDRNAAVCGSSSMKLVVIFACLALPLCYAPNAATQRSPRAETVLCCFVVTEPKLLRECPDCL